MVEKSESYDSAIELSRTLSSSEDDSLSQLCTCSADDLQGDLKEHKKLIECKEQMFALQTETLNMNLEEIQALKKLLNNVGRERNDRQCEISNLKVALELSKNTAHQLQKAVQFTEGSAQQFKQQLQNQIASTISLQDALKCTTHELEQLKVCTDQERQNVMFKDTLVRRLKFELSEMEEQYSRIFEENIKQNKYLDMQRESNLALRLQMSTLEQDVGILELQLKRAQNTIRSYEAVMRDYCALKNKISQLWTELDKVKQCECKNALLRQQVDQLSRDLSDLQQLLEDKNKQMLEMEKYRDTCDNASAEIMEQCSLALSEQRSKYDQLLLDMGAEIQQITEQLQSLQEARTECEAEASNGALQATLCDVKVQNDHLVQQLQRVDQQNQELRYQLTEQTKEISGLCQNLSDTRAALDRAERTLLDTESNSRQEQQAASERETQLEYYKEKNEMLKELLKTRTDEVCTLQSQQTFHMNSVGMLRKQHECQQQTYKQEIEQLKKQVADLSTSLNRSEYKYTSVMRELCQTQATLLHYTEREANRETGQMATQSGEFPNHDICEPSQQKTTVPGVETEGCYESRDDQAEVTRDSGNEETPCQNVMTEYDNQQSHLHSGGSFSTDSGSVDELTAVREQLSVVQQQLLQAHAQLARANHEKRMLANQLQASSGQNAKADAEISTLRQELCSAQDATNARNRAADARMSAMRDKWAQRNEQLSAELATMHASFQQLREQYRCTTDLLSRRDSELNSANAICADLRARSRSVVRDVHAWQREQRTIQRELAGNVKRLNEQLVRGKEEKQNLLNKINCLQKANSQLYKDLSQQKITTFEVTSEEFTQNSTQNRYYIGPQNTWPEAQTETTKQSSIQEEEYVSTDPGLVTDSRWLDQVESITAQLQRTSSYWNKILECANLEDT